MSPPAQPILGADCALERFLKNRSRGRQATHTVSIAFPNSRSRTRPRSATGIRADARAYTPARDGGLREKACSTAFPGQPAKAEPSRLCETSRRGPTTAERFSEHLRAASGALGQSRTGLLRRAVRAVELWRNLQVRRCKPDPLAADIVHVREDRRNGADVVFSGVFAERFGCRRSGPPGGRVKMFDKNLIDAIVGEKDPGGKVLDCGSAELSVNLGLTRGHGSLLLDL